MPSTRLDTPVESEDRVPPPRGGWSREGWSDTGPERGPRRDGPYADRGSGREGDGWRDRGPGGFAPRDEWRRQTWDGGRGQAFRYRRGARLPRIFVSPRYAVADWERYDLPPPGPGGRWVRYYDDAVLVDARGFVLDAVPGIGWDAYDRGSRAAHRHGPYHHRDRGGYPAGAYYGSVPRVEHHGPGPAPSIHHGAGGVTTIVIRSPSAVMTTTTTTVEESYVPSRSKRAWKAPARKMVQTKPRRSVQTKPGR